MQPRPVPVVRGMAHWDHARRDFPRVEPPETAEVVIIGGGLTGLATALVLAESGRRCVVIEREWLGAGASGHNGGLLLPGAAEPYHDLVERWGRDTARRIHSWFDQGARTLAAWMADYEIDCLWRPEGSFHAASSLAEARDLARGADWLAGDGFEAEWLTAPDASRLLGLSVQIGTGEPEDVVASGPATADALAADNPFSVWGAQTMPHGGAFHSGLLVTGLAAAAARLGVRFAEGVAATAVSESGHGARVVTRTGKIDCDVVVVAVNAWTSALCPAAITPVRGQVLSTAPVPGVRIPGGWSLNRGYEYLQQLPDSRLVFGGMRWSVPGMEVNVAEAETRPEILARLAECLAGVLPASPPDPLVEHTWAGLMAFTSDRLPLVGPMPDRERVWMAAGFNGHGVPSAPASAGLLASQINGAPTDPDAAFLSPARVLT